MLFDAAELPRHRVDERGGIEDAKIRKRFGPIRHGKPTLVRIDLDKHADGSPKIHKPKIASSISFKCTIIEGQQQNRWFFDRFVLSGFKPGQQRTRDCLISALMCYERNPKEIRVGLIDGLIVPVVVLQEKHWQTGKTQNVIHPLNPHPHHTDAEDYHALVSRVMMPDDHGHFAMTVPGWDLYPESKTYKLIQKRLRDRLEATDAGLTRLQERRMRMVALVEERFLAAA